MSNYPLQPYAPNALTTVTSLLSILGFCAQVPASPVIENDSIVTENELKDKEIDKLYQAYSQQPSLQTARPLLYAYLIAKSEFSNSPSHQQKLKELNAKIADLDLYVTKRVEEHLSENIKVDAQNKNARKKLKRKVIANFLKAREHSRFAALLIDHYLISEGAGVHIRADFKHGNSMGLFRIDDNKIHLPEQVFGVDYASLLRHEAIHGAMARLFLPDAMKKQGILSASDYADILVAKLSNLYNVGNPFAVGDENAKNHFIQALSQANNRFQELDNLLKQTQLSRNEKSRLNSYLEAVENYKPKFFYLYTDEQYQSLRQQYGLVLGKQTRLGNTQLTLPQSDITVRVFNLISVTSYPGGYQQLEIEVLELSAQQRAKMLLEKYIYIFNKIQNDYQPSTRLAEWTANLFEHFSEQQLNIFFPELYDFLKQSVRP